MCAHRVCICTHKCPTARVGRGEEVRGQLWNLFFHLYVGSEEPAQVTRLCGKCLSPRAILQVLNVYSSEEHFRHVVF